MLELKNKSVRFGAVSGRGFAFDAAPARGFAFAASIACVASIALAAGVAFVFMSLFVGTPAAFASEDSITSEPGEILVLSTPLTNANMREVSPLSSYGVAYTEEIDVDLPQEQTLTLVVLEDDTCTDEVINRLNAQPGVVYAQRNYTYYLIDDVADDAADGVSLRGIVGTQDILTASAATNDPYLSKQWYLDAWGTDTGYGANVYEAWEKVQALTSKTSQSASVTVAVLDTGVLSTHEDLSANIDLAHAKDIYNNKASGTISDSNGHGTHVCGIVSATANNGVGIAGVSYNACVLPLDIFNDSTGKTNTGVVVKAYSYLQSLMTSGELSDLHVINLSLGGYSAESDDDIALHNMITTFRSDYNVLTVCAGGNGNTAHTSPRTDRILPGDYDECLCVTALTKTGGNVVYSDYNEWKDISAPGLSIYSTNNTASVPYRYMSGTSMATPIVSAVAALLWVVNPNLSVDEAVCALTTTTHAVTQDSNYHATSGSKGAIDAAAAVQYVLDNTSRIDASVMRVAGQTARDTSARIAATAWTEGETSEWAILARDDDFADAMSSTGLAGALDAPIVLTERDRLSDVAKDTLINLGVKRVYIIGGEGAMPGDFENELAALGITSERISGQNRYDTSVECAEKIAEYGGSEYAVVAVSQKFQDALSMSSFAYKYHAPILLQTFGDTADERGLTEEAQSLLAGSGAFVRAQVFVAGGTAAVSDASMTFLGRDYVRMWGDNGYETSLAIANEMVARGLLSADTVCVATGAKDARGRDALSGAALAGRAGGVMLLVSAQPDMETENYVTIDGFIAEHKDEISTAYVLGGTTVMPEVNTVAKIKAALSYKP